MRVVPLCRDCWYPKKRTVKIITLPPIRIRYIQYVLCNHPSTLSGTVFCWCFSSFVYTTAYCTALHYTACVVVFSYYFSVILFNSIPYVMPYHVIPSRTVRTKVKYSIILLTSLLVLFILIQ